MTKKEATGDLVISITISTKQLKLSAKKNLEFTQPNIKWYISRLTVVACSFFLNYDLQMLNLLGLAKSYNILLINLLAFELMYVC